MDLVHIDSNGPTFERPVFRSAQDSATVLPDWTQISRPIWQRCSASSVLARMLMLTSSWQSRLSVWLQSCRSGLVKVELSCLHVIGSVITSISQHVWNVLNGMGCYMIFFCSMNINVLMLLSINVLRQFRWLYQCIDVFSQKCSETISMVRLHFKHCLIDLNWGWITYQVSYALHARPSALGQQSHLIQNIIVSSSIRGRSNWNKCFQCLGATR